MLNRWLDLSWILWSLPLSALGYWMWRKRHGSTFWYERVPWTVGFAGVLVWLSYALFVVLDGLGNGKPYTAIVLTPSNFSVPSGGRSPFHFAMGSPAPSSPRNAQVSIEGETVDLDQTSAPPGKVIAWARRGHLTGKLYVDSVRVAP